MPSGVEAIHERIQRLLRSIQDPDEPVVLTVTGPCLWLPAVVCGLDIPFMELEEAEQAAFLEAIDLGHWHDPDGHEYLMVSLKTVLSDLVFRGRAATALAYVAWVTQFMAAMLEHGTYDPGKGHEAAVGQEIDILEVRERCRDAGLAFLEHMHEKE